MKKISITTVPSKFLREPTEKVGSFDNALKTQIAEMTKTLRAEKGIGFAANQLGYDNRVVLAEFDDKKNKIPLTVFINPEIVEISKESECLEEGCLSVPKIELEVVRANALKIRYQNKDGRKMKMAPKGLLARILQHEIDHLNGVIFTERAKQQLFQKYPELKKIKILFFGTGEYATIILKGLILLGFDLGIVTEKAKPSGRNQETNPTPVAQVAEQFGKQFTEIEKISHFTYPISHFDLLILSDFGQILPDEILKMPKIAALNIHPSLLPKYRGPSPIQTAILKGEKETGVSIIKMTPEIDKGPILAQVSSEILKNDDYPKLRDRLATLGLKLLVKALPDIAQNKLKEIMQDENAASFTHKFTKTDGEINWQKSPQEIERQIRALSPWPGSYSYIDNKRLIIRKAHLVENKLVLDVVQPEGKKPMKWQDFLRGFHSQKPEWLKIIDIK